MENHDINFNRVFTQCYATFAGQPESYLLRIVRDKDTAQELVHDVFLRIYERRIALDVEMETTRFYLYKIAKNMAFDLLRKKMRQDACFDDIVLQEVCLNDQFYRDYQAGRLDIRAYLEFALKVLSEHPKEQLDAWHRDCMREVVEPMIRPKAEALLAQHRKIGDFLLIITATNDILKKLQVVGKPLGVYSLETVRMFRNDAVQAGFAL